MFDFGKELMRRRVPQIVGAYLAGGWILLEFTDWTVSRYVLSPHLIDFVVASWLLLLPAVAMIAWNHGRPGRDAFTRGEAVGLALNLVFAALVLFSMFRGRDLGAATSEVQVTDEQGRTVTRSVPKPEFRHRVALFSFRNASGDPALDWLQFALPQAVRIDLRQDAFVAGVGTSNRETESGDPDHPLLFSIARQREIAAERDAGTFVTGRFSRAPGGLEARLELYDTERGMLRTERILAAADPMQLADSISTRLRRDLGVPGGHIDATADLPVRELLSESDAALRPFFAGLFHLASEIDVAKRSFEEAVREDSTFARAQMWLGTLRVSSNEGAEGLQALEAAMRHEYRLEESSRFLLRTEYFRVSGEPERAIEVARMRTELYPDDGEGFEMLARLLRWSGDEPGALAAYESALALDPSRSGILKQIGDIHASAGDEAQALRAYREYARHNAESAEPDLAIGTYFLGAGQLDSAAAHFDRARLLEPSSPDPIFGEISVALYEGRVADADARLARSARVLRTARDSLGYFELEREARELAGRTREALASARDAILLRERLEGPASAEQSRGFSASLAARMGSEAEARALLDTMTATLQPPFDDIVSLAEALVARELSDAATIRRALPEVRQLLVAKGAGSLAWLADFLEAESLRLEGRCSEAIPLYASASGPQVRAYLFGLNREIGADPLTRHAACLRELGRSDEAAGLLAVVLRRVPGEPHARVELARLEAARGDRAAALRELDAALATWAGADPGYRPAIEARAWRVALTS